MNRILYTKVFSYFIMLIMLSQFSSQQSVMGRQKPPVNIYGTLKDQGGETYEVENITISGLYEQIPVYKMPTRSKTRPESNTTRLDLHEIRSIRVPYENEAPKIHTINKRDYIEIEVISNDSKQTKNNYIIERSRKIFCDEKNEAGPIEKEVAFEALDTLTINGQMNQQPQHSPRLITQ